MAKKTPTLFFLSVISFIGAANLALSQTVDGQAAISMIANGEILGSHFTEQILSWLFVVIYDGSLWQCRLSITPSSWVAACYNGTG